MDNGSYDAQVAALVGDAISSTIGSVNGAAKAAAIPYSSLDRKLKGLTGFTISELRRIAAATGRSTHDFVPADERMTFIPEAAAS